MALIDVRGVSKSYQMGEFEVPVLSGVDLAIERGEFVTLYGPSGSGKTTLLNILAGIDAADEGHVVVDGLDLRTARDRALTAYRRQAVGYVFQFYNLVPTLTALENVALALELQGKPGDQAAVEALEAVGLGDKLDRFPSQLSGGEQQRVAIARALVKDPIVLAGDEPTGNLDAKTSVGIIDLLVRLNKERGLTVLLATHDPGLASRHTRVIELLDGRLVNVEDARQLLGGEVATEQSEAA